MHIRLLSCSFCLFFLSAPGLNLGLWDLVPWPGIEPGPPALEVQNLSHWTTKEVPRVSEWKLLSHVWLFVTPGLPSPWNSPGQNTAVGRLSLLQGIFPTQGLNPGLLHYRWISSWATREVPNWLLSRHDTKLLFCLPRTPRFIYIWNALSST